MCASQEVLRLHKEVDSRAAVKQAGVVLEDLVAAAQAVVEAVAVVAAPVEPAVAVEDQVVVLAASEEVSAEF